MFDYSNAIRHTHAYTKLLHKITHLKLQTIKQFQLTSIKNGILITYWINLI